MENNPWDDQLRDLLGEYKSGEPASTTGKPDVELNTEETDLTLPEDQVQAWKRIEASLNASDQAFDETVRQRVKDYQPPHDPHAWPNFLNHWNDSRFLRAKLIVMKSIEVAAVLLILLTVVNMGRMGKLPFESNIFNEKGSPSNENRSENNQIENIQAPAPSSSDKINDDFTLLENENSNSTSASSITGDAKTLTQPNGNLIAAKNESNNQLPSNLTSGNAKGTLSHDLLAIAPVSEIPVISPGGIQYEDAASKVDFHPALHNAFTTEPLASVDFLVDYRNFESVPGPKFVKPVSRSYTEFSILVQSDYNALRMPEDRLYSSGQQITFPSKGILSHGFGAGFTVAIGHPMWAIESGVIYSAKDFKPGRQLIVGGAFDNGSVDFGAMKLQLVTVPLQYRYRFDPHGRFKTYVTAGGGFHMIVQSDIDVRGIL